jgi:hypothetical protein
MEWGNFNKLTCDGKNYLQGCRTLEVRTKFDHPSIKGSLSIRFSFRIVEAWVRGARIGDVISHAAAATATSLHRHPHWRAFTTSDLVSTPDIDISASLAR